MGLAALAMVYSLFVRFYDPTVPRGATTIVSLILGFGGLQLFATAIVGEYVGKILEETKKRPKYIVKSITHGPEKLLTSAEVHSFLQERKKQAETGV
jgi:dolichol-phosphate mannosyltransferase